MFGKTTMQNLKLNKLTQYTSGIQMFHIFEGTTMKNLFSKIAVIILAADLDRLWLQQISKSG